jgi:hypothetical protein
MWGERGLDLQATGYDGIHEMQHYVIGLALGARVVGGIFS